MSDDRWLICAGQPDHVDVNVTCEGGEEDSFSMSLDEALEFAAGIVGAAQNTARYQGLSNDEFNERFHRAMNANAAEYANRKDGAS